MRRRHAHTVGGLADSLTSGSTNPANTRIMMCGRAGDSSRLGMDGVAYNTCVYIIGLLGCGGRGRLDRRSPPEFGAEITFEIKKYILKIQKSKPLGGEANKLLSSVCC